MRKFHHNSSASGAGRDGEARALRSYGEDSRLIRQLAAGAFLFIIGTALGVLLASLPVRNRVGLGFSFRDLLHLPGIGSLTWYACLLSSPLYVWMARRFPIYGRRWRRNFALHFLITTALVVLTGLIFFRLLVAPVNNSPARSGAAAAETSGPKNTGGQTRSPMPGRPPSRGLGSFLLSRLLTESLPFWAMIALIHAFEFHRRYRQRDVETARLQAQLAQSRLEALTAQLHPHFLFNTLQGVSTLMRRDVEAADAMLSRLSDLLRQTLQRGDRQQATLGEELEVLDHYVEISRERFKDRLVFETSVPDGMRNALVPFFILQPLVENALRHGIERRAGAGQVTVSAERRGDALYLCVTDNGPGLSTDERAFPNEGIGLSNTRQRLRQLYGDQQSLNLETPAEGGLKVELTIPYGEAPIPELHEVNS